MASLCGRKRGTTTCVCPRSDAVPLKTKTDESGESYAGVADCHAEKALQFPSGPRVIGARIWKAARKLDARPLRLPSPTQPSASKLGKNMLDDPLNFTVEFLVFTAKAIVDPANAVTPDGGRRCRPAFCSAHFRMVKAGLCGGEPSLTPT
jgi:hypothetical protein